MPPSSDLSPMSNVATPTDLAQRIADLVISTYNGLQTKSAKPTIRLNGVSEWTILAGLVAIEDNELTPLTLATGVKTMPNQIRKYSEGLIVHDLHAEILCLRMFNRYLMDEIVRSQGEEASTEEGEKAVREGRKRALSTDVDAASLKRIGRTSDFSKEGEEENGQCEMFPGSIDTSKPLLKKGASSLGTNTLRHRTSQSNYSLSTHADNSHTTQRNRTHRINILHRRPDSSKFSLREGIQLALYISEPPCGDASMSNVSTDEEAWRQPTDIDIIRGRAHFNTVGIVRTKPGRADSLVSYSKSCSDKLCLKQFTGILNAINSLCIEPIYLLYLVIPREKHSETDFQRCFFGRLLSVPPSLQLHPIKSLPFERDDFPFKKQSQSSCPLPLCLAYCKLNNVLQVLHNGVKNGAYIKNKPPKQKGASILCRYSLWQQALGHIVDFDNYSAIKTSNAAREKVKAAARELMGQWPRSAAEGIQMERKSHGGC